MRRRRTVATAALTLALALTGSAVAGADTGTERLRADRVTVEQQDRMRDGAVHDRPVDWATDRRVDRPADRPGDRPLQCDRDRAPDRPVDCRSDERPDDRRIDRPTLARCVHWLLENTDVDYGDNIRRWVWACHRLLNHFNQPL